MLTLNPDLVIEHEGNAIATGDVKYKLSSGDWKRGDLYQAVAFATGFGVDRAAICEFRTANVPRLQTVAVGSVRVSHLAWPSDAETGAETAAQEFLSEFALWLDPLYNEATASMADVAER
jgi:hypothetical protein